MPGTYLAGVHELRTMVYTETGNGDPESTETLVNTIDGTAVRLLVEGHPLDVRTGSLLHHERVLDFRAGTLARELRWRSPGGRAVEVSSTRLVSLDRRGVLALRYTVRALEPARRVSCLQPVLVANTQQPHLSRDLHPRRRRPCYPAPLCSPQEHERRRARRGSPSCHLSPCAPWLAGRRPPPHHDVDGAGRGSTGYGRGLCPTMPGSPCARSWNRGSGHSSPSSSPTAGRATGRGPRCATRSTPPSPPRSPPAGTGCSQQPAAYLDGVLGRGRRRGRRGRRDPAGGPVRAVPRAAGRRPGRAALDPGQGPDRPRLRRPRLLGHRDVRAAGAHLHRARRPPRDALRWRHRTLPARERAPRARSGRRRLPVAHDPRRGVLGLLAGRHGRLPRQRRHGRRRRALRGRDRGRGVRAGHRRRAAGRDRPAVARLGHHDAPGASASTG